MLISTHMQLNTGIAPSKRANHSQIRRDTMMLVPEEGQHHEKLILKKILVSAAMHYGKTLIPPTEHSGL